jgi:hypothetical protein
MFQSSTKRLRALLDVVDDMLAGDFPADADESRVDADDSQVDADGETPRWTTHPHRRPLRWQPARRAGSVPAAPAYCLCPVRAAPTEISERPSVRDPGHALTN